MVNTTWTGSEVTKRETDTAALASCLAILICGIVTTVGAIAVAVIAIRLIT